MDTAIGIVPLLLFGGWLFGLLGRRVVCLLPRGAELRAPWCELATALLWAICGLRMVTGAAPVWWLPVPLCLGLLGVLLAGVDLAAQRLPNVLTVATFCSLGVLIGVAALLGPGAGLLVRAALGMLVFGGTHLAVHLLAPDSLGGGDVKLALGLGGVLGAVGMSAVLLATVLAGALTAALALGARLAAYPRWRGGIPHGPGLLAATWLFAAFPGAGLLISG